MIEVLSTTVQTKGCMQLTQTAFMSGCQSILTAWWAENRQCSHGIQQTNLPIWKRLGDLRATLASEGLIFSHRPSIITEKGPKWTKIFLRREQKNTYRRSLGKKGRLLVYRHSFPYLLRLDANWLSKRISLKEIVFKLTFRWKRHWRTSQFFRVRVHGGEGRVKKTYSSKSFSTPKAEHNRNPPLIRAH